MRYEHKVNIDRSKETDRFYYMYEFTNLRIIVREREKKVQKKVTAIVECRFQFMHIS